MKSFVTSMFPTGLLVSGFVLTIFQLLTTAGAPLYVLFIIYSCFQAFFIIFAAIFQPWKVFTINDIKKRKEKEAPVEIAMDEVPKVPIDPPTPPSPSEIVQKDPEEIREEERPYFINEVTHLDFDHSIEDIPPTPRDTPEEPLKDVAEIAPNNPSPDSTPTPSKSEEKLEEKTDKAPKDTPKPFPKVHICRQFFSIEYFFVCIFLSINSLIFTWYTGTLFNQFALMGDTNSNFATAFNFSILIVLVLFPTYGFIIRFLGTSLSLILSIVLSNLLMTVISIPFIYIQPIGFVLFAFGRPFLISSALDYFYIT